jgi:hypothetical protein
VQFAHALNRLFEAVRSPKRLAREAVAPYRFRAYELAQRLDNAAVDRRRRERLFALALDRLTPAPRDQAGNVGVRDLVKALVRAEVFREKVKRVLRPRAVAMMLAYLLPVAPGRVPQQKRTVAGPPFRFQVRVRLGLQLALDCARVFFVSGLGIARKSMAPKEEVVAIGFRVGTLVD